MGRIGKWLLLCLATCSALASTGVATAAAADTHVFDPVLSLTGNCSTSTVDTVEDPGCPDGPQPPSGPFSSPRAVTTDSYGNIYVASYGRDVADGAEGRIDIFDSSGKFITEIVDPNGPKSLAVDSDGNLYVFNFRAAPASVQEIVRYEPTIYNPALGEIAYDNPPELVIDLPSGAFLTGISINRLDDHLFVNRADHVEEYSSASEGNKLIDATIGEGEISNFNAIGLAVDATHGRIYASTSHAVKVFELDSPHALLLTIDQAPGGGELGNNLTVAADEGTGNFFIYDGLGANVVYEYTLSGKYVSTISYGIKNVTGAQIAVDNGINSPNGALHPDGRYLFVPSHPGGVGHVFAYGPREIECPPVVESVSFAEITEDDAELRATINPCNLETTYVFEYTMQASFEAEAFAGAEVAGEGQLLAGKVGTDVSAAAIGLEPGTSYRFRVVATNKLGNDEDEDSFATYPSNPLPPCPNDPLRTGFSALLPDCRAYELVTPGDTNGRAPIGIGGLGTRFTTRLASPAGDKLSFAIEGGAIPGSEGTGSLGGDPYRSVRGSDGWTTANTGPNGAETTAALPGSTSPDQGYSFWGTSPKGSAAVEEKTTSYVRYPDGHSELVGRGSLNTDPFARGKLISENGSHIVFTSAQRLEEEAPPQGTAAVYDRTPNEVTHVVSLLPGDVTPAGGEDARYVGVSMDGEGVAFTIGATLYLRHDNEETYEIGDNVTFAGVAEGGGRIFYVEGGNLLAFDVATESVIPFSSSADVTVVNVSADGTAAYLVSPSVLTGESNPIGATPQAGKENLYFSEEGTVSFVGTVTERDVEGETPGQVTVEGLGLWTEAVGPGEAETPARLSIDPSRSTPDGRVLLFEARADLTAYDSGGHVQIYRYDSVTGDLRCLSCN
ncbi:MAG: hypothetical protein M3335_04070, partial [Actinomycetota bacterium]|nr:hypothetical protein [Actinomycetota bacterium]